MIVIAVVAMMFITLMWESRGCRQDISYTMRARPANLWSRGRGERSYRDFCTCHRGCGASGIRVTRVDRVVDMWVMVVRM